MSNEILYQLKYFGDKVTLSELRDFVDKALGFDDDTNIVIGHDALTIEVEPEKPDHTTVSGAWLGVEITKSSGAIDIQGIQQRLDEEQELSNIRLDEMADRLDEFNEKIEKALPPTTTIHVEGTVSTEGFSKKILETLAEEEKRLQKRFWRGN